MNTPEPAILIRQYLQTLLMRNCSERTVSSWRYILERFTEWCQQRGINCMSQVTPKIIAAYRRSLFHYRKPKTGEALKFDTQAHYLIAIRRWFNWMAEGTYLELDPAREIELPKSEKRLPTSVMTIEEVESLLNVPDVKTDLGLRDRAIMETFYSSGIRCSELVALDVYDVNLERQIVTVRFGKGKKDRVVPIGQRAIAWIRLFSCPKTDAALDPTTYLMSLSDT